MPGLRAWLNRLPKPLVESLRRVRTAALVLLDPLDRLHRRVMHAGSRGPLPPLWLRRQAGPIWAFERAAAEIATTIAVLDLVHPAAHVLDIGCGSGAMAFEFQRMLGPSGRYVGFDVHRPSIEWCRRHFRTDARFRFDHADLRTAWSDGSEEAGTYLFPIADGGADFVLAKSVFTHLLEREARHYLGETRRVLAAGGKGMVTTFLLSSDAPTRPASLPDLTFPFGTGPIRWNVQARPESAVAYDESHFLGIIAAARLRTERVLRGSWSGRGLGANAQDIVIVSCA